MGGNHSSKSYWVSLEEVDGMRGLSFHVYKGEEVLRSDISIDDLEEFLVKHHGHLHKFEIVALEDPEYDDASF